MAALSVELLPALADNYIYLVHEPASGTVVAVDPGTADPVIGALEARGWSLDLILNTHHHADHTGGNDALKARYGARVIGPAAEAGRIPALDRAVGPGDRLSIGDQRGEVLGVPGHTAGHIAFWFQACQTLFCGDTLFSLGCGRLFEGTADDMWQSLVRLRGLPDDTQIYCGHEYTESNARFAVAIDPDNRALRAAADRIAAQRRAGTPTIPARLGDEKRINPFLRADTPALQEALGRGGDDPVAVFADIRARKDRF